MKDEVKAGILNAMQRGSTLQDAVDSFTNAGYNASEVEAAAKEISGATDIIKDMKEKPLPPQTLQVQQIQQSQPEQFQSQQPKLETPKDNTPAPPAEDFHSNTPKALPSILEEPPKNSKTKRVIIFIIILLVILAGMIALLTLFSSEILDFFFGGA